MRHRLSIASLSGALLLAVAMVGAKAQGNQPAPRQVQVSLLKHPRTVVVDHRVADPPDMPVSRAPGVVDIRTASQGEEQGSQRLVYGLKAFGRWRLSDLAGCIKGTGISLHFPSEGEVIRLGYRRGLYAAARGFANDERFSIDVWRTSQKAIFIAVPRVGGLAPTTPWYASTVLGGPTSCDGTGLTTAIGWGDRVPDKGSTPPARRTLRSHR